VRLLRTDGVRLEVELALAPLRVAGRLTLQATLGTASAAPAQATVEPPPTALTGAERVLSEAIGEAVAQDGFLLVYQPIVSLAHAPGERYEVLLRMIDPSGAEIAARDFLSIAERSGLLPEIDRWVVRRAIAVLADRERRGVQTSFFVNLSGASVEDPGLLDWLGARLAEADLPGERLIFELPEPLVLSRPDRVKPFAAGLRQHGCGFAVSHLKSGARSSMLLRHLPLDYLKIDGSLTRGLARSPEKQDRVRAIVELARSLDIATVAELIEDAGSLPVLWHCGVTYIQGNFLQAPYRDLAYDFEGAE
jgi:multidomain signaling protein FimX